METLINNFDFNGHSVRVINGENGQVFFVAKDVCDILGYSNSRDAIAKHCKKEGVAICDTPTESGIQQMAVINEGNLYRLVLKSKKKEAEKFETLVCDEILPAIRKTGKYEAQPQQPIALPTMKELALAVIRAEEEKEQLLLENAKLAPKAEYTEKVLQSSRCYTATEIAKELSMSAMSLNKKLVEKKVQYKHRDHYVLTHKYQDKNYTDTETFPYINSKGEVITSMQTVWTERGRAFIHSLFNPDLSFYRGTTPMPTPTTPPRAYL